MVNLPMEAPWQYLLAQTTSQMFSIYWDTAFRDRRLGNQIATFEMLLEEFLKPLGVTQSALAVRMGVAFPRINGVIRGVAARRLQER